MKLALFLTSALVTFALPAIAQSVSKTSTRWPANISDSMSKGGRLSTTTITGSGGADPGGGGVVAGENGAETLAGAKWIERKMLSWPSQQLPEYYEIPAETKKALRGIFEKLPQTSGARKLHKLALGSQKDFLKQDSIDSADYEKVTSTYEQVIKSFGKNLDPSLFLLLAYSKDGQTYVLPAFDKLTQPCSGLNQESCTDPYPPHERKQIGHRQQALNLIHEGLMRSLVRYDRGQPIDAAEKLKLVLDVDVLIHDILEQGLTDELRVQFAEAMIKVRLGDRSELYFEAFGLLQSRLGRPIYESEFFFDGELRPKGANDRYEVLFDDMREYLDLDGKAIPNLIQRFDKLVPGISTLFGYARAKAEYLGRVSGPKPIISSVSFEYERPQLNKLCFENVGPDVEPGSSRANLLFIRPGGQVIYRLKCDPSSTNKDNLAVVVHKVTFH